MLPHVHLGAPLTEAEGVRTRWRRSILRAVAGDRYEVASAGTKRTRVHPLAIKAMSEVDVDISGHTSKTVEGLLDQPWEYVITVCDSANERCPFFPARTTRLHWSFPDPSQASGTEEQRLDVFRSVRDAIRTRIAEWVTDRERHQSR